TRRPAPCATTGSPSSAASAERANGSRFPCLTSELGWRRSSSCCVRDWAGRRRRRSRPLPACRRTWRRWGAWPRRRGKVSFAATYVDEIAAVQRSGGAALVRQKLAALSEGERRVLREALAEAPSS